MIRTTDKALRFDAAPRSLAVLDDVESRGEAQSRWVQELKEICLDAADHDWDGEGAAPVQDGALNYAIAFVAELAQGVRFPDAGVDPDGEISLEWRVREDAFSVSISSEGRLSYAGLFGESDCHGTEWMGEQVPAQVLRQLDRLILSL
ncbi:MAG: hypothetical protein OXJ37_04610 [Bryobacterales bacterium]|nr:hypothetical protein [Bryobacterales bacterium]